jgi:hypothetical protein
MDDFDPPGSDDRDDDDNRPVFEFRCYARLTPDEDCELFGEEQDAGQFDDEHDANKAAGLVRCTSCGGKLQARERA